MARASSPSLIGVGGGRKRADTEIADDLVVMLRVGSGNKPADAGQQSGYRQSLLLDLRPVGSD